jgi:hypothetical protein
MLRELPPVLEVERHDLDPILERVRPGEVAGERPHALSGLQEASSDVQIVDDPIRIYHRGSLIRSHERRNPKEKEEVIGSHHRQQKKRSVL